MNLELLKLVVVNFPNFLGLMVAIYIFREEAKYNRQMINRLIDHLVDDDEVREKIVNGDD